MGLSAADPARVEPGLHRGAGRTARELSRAVLSSKRLGSWTTASPRPPPSLHPHAPSLPPSIPTRLSPALPDGGDFLYFHSFSNEQLLHYLISLKIIIYLKNRKCKTKPYVPRRFEPRRLRAFPAGTGLGRAWGALGWGAPEGAVGQLSRTLDAALRALLCGGSCDPGLGGVSLLPALSQRVCGMGTTNLTGRLFPALPEQPLAPPRHRGDHSSAPGLPASPPHNACTALPRSRVRESLRTVLPAAGGPSIDVVTLGPWELVGRRQEWGRHPQSPGLSPGQPPSSRWPGPPHLHIPGPQDPPVGTGLWGQAAPRNRLFRPPRRLASARPWGAGRRNAGLLVRGGCGCGLCENRKPNGRWGDGAGGGATGTGQEGPRRRTDLGYLCTHAPPTPRPL